MSTSAGYAVGDAVVLNGAQPPAGLGAERATLWTIERELWAPRTVRLGEGAALTAGRPHTAYRKIVDVYAGSLREFRELVRAAVADILPNPSGSRPAPIVVKFEEHPNRAPLTEQHHAILLELGFVQSLAPFPSVASTRVDSLDLTRGWSKWLSGAPQRHVSYYGQTTDVTCGPTAALMSFEQSGMHRFGTDRDENQATEIAMWRRATNYPACDPVSLALTIAEDMDQFGHSGELASPSQQVSPPTVILSAPGLVLIDDEPTNEDEIRLRKALQLDALRRAELSGLPVERRWFTAAEIRDIVARGANVLLLISLLPLINDPNAHWVLVHDVLDDTLIVSDPWVESGRGESWVDCSEMPIPLAGIDLIAKWGDPVYRAIIVLPR